MENFRILSVDKDSNGQHTLRLFIHEHEVEATFAAEENPMLFPRLKQVLFDAYTQSMSAAKSV